MTAKPGTDMIPVAPLKIIAMDNCIDIGREISEHILNIRTSSKRTTNIPNIEGYIQDNYLVSYHIDTHHTGERHAVIDESVRGSDLFILTDVVNNSTHEKNSAKQGYMTPDEHIMDLRRIIAACHGTPHRINVIMPYLYAGRYNNRKNLESLDCALTLQDMISMGISNIITFDAHEPRVQNAIPIQGIDNFPTSYQFIKAFIENEPELSFTKESLNIVSPDVGGMSRVVFYSNIMEVNMGMFYRRKNYSITNENGEHPVVAIEFLGGDIKGKDIIIVDDMIDTGKSMINTALELKKRGAAKIIMAATFGLFSQGLDAFDMAYKEGLLDSLYTTNLTYCSEELKAKPYYKLVDMSIPLAKLLDTINYDDSFSKLTNQAALIKQLLKEKKING